MQKILGIIVVLGAVVGGFIIAGGNVATLWQPSEFIVIFGAALGAVVIGASKQTLLDIKQQIVRLFKSSESEETANKELLILMYQLVELAKGRGVKALDDHIENPETSSIFLSFPTVESNPKLVSFICDNMRLLSMGKVTAHDFDYLLDQEVNALATEKLKASEIVANTADAMPGFGILAAVGGIVITMQHLDGPMSEIGYHVAAALVGTFIGIFACYCLFGPLAQGMETQVKKDIGQLEVCKAIMVAYANGHAALVATDSGRRLLKETAKPSFTEMEQWINSQEAA
ncbi:flagellar motor stator protein MotA [Alteromonas sp. S015]|uniref:flagellar motor stator protein MotA n=1 Tax=Alteromonas sp. S015 TaxID=3117401 RepID=UPI002FE3F460